MKTAVNIERREYIRLTRQLQAACVARYGAGSSFCIVARGDKGTEQWRAFVLAMDGVERIAAATDTRGVLTGAQEHFGLAQAAP